MSVLAPGRNLVLCGMTGAGKTTVGRILGERLGRPFVDTDAVVEAEAHESIPEIFARAGERGFRRLEAEAIRRVSALRGQVIAVGGGALMDPANLTHLRSTGDLVVLAAALEVLARRAAAQPDTRPLLDVANPAEALAELSAARASTFERAAALTLDTTDEAPEAVAEQILAWARSRPGLLSREEVAAL